MNSRRSLISSPIQKPEQVFEVRIKIYANLLDSELDKFESSRPAFDLFYQTPDHCETKGAFYDKFVWITFSFLTVQAKHIFLKNFYSLEWKKQPEVQ